MALLQQQHINLTHHLPPAAAAVALSHNLRAPSSTCLIPRSSSDIAPSSVDIVSSCGRLAPPNPSSSFGSVQKLPIGTAIEYIFSSDITTVARELDSCGIDGKLRWIRDPFSAAGNNEACDYGRQVMFMFPSKRKFTAPVESDSTGLGRLIHNGVDDDDDIEYYYKLGSRYYVVDSRSAQLLLHHVDHPADEDSNALALPIFIATTLMTSQYSLSINHLLRVHSSYRCVDRSSSFQFSQMLGNQKMAMLNYINGDNQMCQREDDADDDYGAYGGDCSWPDNYVGCRDDHRLKSQQLVMGCQHVSVWYNRDTRLMATDLGLSEALPESERPIRSDAKQSTLEAEIDDVKPRGGRQKQATTTAAMPQPHKCAGGAAARDLFKCTSFQLCERLVAYPFRNTTIPTSSSRPRPPSSSSSAAAVNYKEGSRRHHRRRRQNYVYYSCDFWPWKALELSKEAVGELAAAANSVAAALAGAGLALILFVASRMLGVHATLDSTKLSYLMRGMGLIWLSSGVKNLASAAPAHLSALRNRRRRQRRRQQSGVDTNSATYMAKLHAVTFRMCVVVILTMFRLA